jgi:hypothetical protein
MSDRLRGPFVGLNPFDTSDAAYFFGRLREIRLLASNILSTPLLVVFGQSGVGKSSLLSAGIVPRLREDPHAVVVLVRDWSGEPLGKCLAALSAEAARLLEPKAATERRLAAAVAAVEEAGGGPVVLILDQFEEYFNHVDQEKGLAFEKALGELVASTSLDVHVAVSIRFDEVGRLDQLRRAIPEIMSATFELTSLGRDDAEEAICRPVDAYNSERGAAVKVDPKLVEALLEDCQIDRVAGSAGGVADRLSARHARGINSSYLQLALARLWEWRGEAGAGAADELSFAAYDQMGRVDRIAAEHFGAVLKGFSPRVRQACARFFQLLVTRSGAKMAVPVEDLAGEARLGDEELRGVLDKLSAGDARILRVAVQHAEFKRQRYEIVHDVLAAPILKWRGDELAKAQEFGDFVVREALRPLDVWDRYVASGLLLSIVQYKEGRLPVAAACAALGVARERLLAVARRLEQRDLLKVEGKKGAASLALADEIPAEVVRNRLQNPAEDAPFACLIDLRNRDVIPIVGGGLPVGRVFQPALGDRAISRAHLLIMKDQANDSLAMELRSLNGSTLNAEPWPYGPVKALASGDIVVLANAVPLLFIAARDFPQIAGWDDVPVADDVPLHLPEVGGSENLWGVVIFGWHRRYALLRSGPVKVYADGTTRPTDRSADRGEDELMTLRPVRGRGIEVSFGTSVDDAQCYFRADDRRETFNSERLDPRQSYFVNGRPDRRGRLRLNRGFYEIIAYWEAMDDGTAPGVQLH